MSKAKIAKLREEIRSLRRPDGSFNPADLVEYGQANPESALHSELEWDDETAAHEYRLLRARRLIKVYVFEPAPRKEGKKVYHFLSVPSRRHMKDKGSFVSAGVLKMKSHEDWRLEIVHEQKSKLRTMMTAYEAVTPELDDVWRAVAALPD